MNTEKLEIEVCQMKDKRIALEEHRRKMVCMQEDEERNMMDSYRKLEETWRDYGESMPELEHLLEEERSLLDKYRGRLMECGEQIKCEIKKEISKIDIELEQAQKKLKNKENTEEKGK